MTPFWLTAFLDLPTAVHDESAAFWAAVAGATVSPARGDHQEFRTLVPSDGDAYVRLQRVDARSPGLHLDVHVSDPRRSADSAVAAGAHEVADLGFVVLRSPGGFAHCWVSSPASTAPAPVRWPQLSRIYQLCLDIPRASYDREVSYWTMLLGGQTTVVRRRPEFSWLDTPDRWALGLLLQRLDEDDGPVRAHLDVGTDDRRGEVARHVGLGARVRREEEFWTVLTDPAGAAYCITDRHPATGTLHDGT